MKILAATLLLLASHAQAIQLSISEIFVQSSIPKKFEADQRTIEFYSFKYPHAELQFNFELPPNPNRSGSWTAAYSVFDFTSFAGGLWSWNNTPEKAVWRGGTSVSGEGASNFNLVAFSLFEPVSFLIQNSIGAAQLAGHGISGFLSPGDYLFTYLDKLTGPGQADGAFSLTLNSVPDGGSTLTLLGMVLAALGIGSRKTRETYKVYAEKARSNSRLLEGLNKCRK